MINKNIKNINYLIIIIIVCLLFVMFIFQKKIFNNSEGFTPKIKSMIRPHIRNINSSYNNITKNYGMGVINTKLRKWNIY